MNNKMSIERIADRLDTLAEITPDKSKMSLERIATALEVLAEVTPASGEASLERIADAVEKYSGGGGSSDFSTAKVTITVDSAEEISFSLLGIQSDNLGFIWGSLVGGDDVTYTIVLYKGVGTVYADNAIFLSVSGDATIDEDTGNVIVRGDCTITA